MELSGRRMARLSPPTRRRACCRRARRRHADRVHGVVAHDDGHVPALPRTTTDGSTSSATRAWAPRRSCRMPTRRLPGRPRRRARSSARSDRPTTLHPGDRGTATLIGVGPASPTAFGVTGAAPGPTEAVGAVTIGRARTATIATAASPANGQRTFGTRSRVRARPATARPRRRSRSPAGRRCRPECAKGRSARTPDGTGRDVGRAPDARRGWPRAPRRRAPRQGGRRDRGAALREPRGGPRRAPGPRRCRPRTRGTRRTGRGAHRATPARRAGSLRGGGRRASARAWTCGSRPRSGWRTARRSPLTGSARDARRRAGSSPPRARTTPPAPPPAPAAGCRGRA